MRLWHKDLICVLPKQQLLGQWRECHLIAKEIHKKGTPNHILVNPVIEYPLKHFYSYCCLVRNVMIQRGYNATMDKIQDYIGNGYSIMDTEDIFKDWHNDRYLFQCCSNLEEKYDRGGITQEEWNKVNAFCLEKHREIIQKQFCEKSNIYNYFSK